MGIRASSIKGHGKIRWLPLNNHIGFWSHNTSDSVKHINAKPEVMKLLEISMGHRLLKVRGLKNRSIHEHVVGGSKNGSL